MSDFSWLPRWFQGAVEIRQYRRLDYALLFLILVGGAFVRFWGLGNVGLHGDEETMAMPAMAILKHGRPDLPSGMLYVRAPLQLYLIAGSAWLFGESEWAFRFPSAVFGSFAGVAAFLMGRRFLPPAYNLAFVASMTYMPAMIEISQTARMYVFWIVSVMAYVALIFRWERDARISSLLLAVLTWLVALQFHTLSIFLAPLFLWPFLSRPSSKGLIWGAGAFFLAFLVFDRYNRFIGRNYPRQLERPAYVGLIERIPGLEVFSHTHLWPILLALIGIAGLAGLLVYRSVRNFGWSAVVPAALLCAGLVAMALLQFNVGGSLFVFGAVLWLRTATMPRRPLVIALLIALAIAAAYTLILHRTGQFPGRKVIGAVVGEPSVWPMLRLMQSCPAGAALLVAGLIVALFSFAKGALLPDFALFLGVAVWFPLVVMGFIQWDVEQRYTMGQLPALLMCAFASLALLLRRWAARADQAARRPGVLGALGIATLAVVNPQALLQTINPQYGPFPDHKGAAEYIKSLDLGTTSILIAEDVLQQTYYLGKVDYWLRQIDDAQHFCVVKDGRLIDQYTSTPVIGTGAELAAVLDRASGKDIYILGTGEDFIDGHASYRGRGIQQVLDSGRLKVVYNGRDGKTKVWKLVHQ